MDFPNEKPENALTREEMSLILNALTLMQFYQSDNKDVYNQCEKIRCKLMHELRADE